MKLATLGLLPILSCEKLLASEGVMDGEYRKCECSTRLYTNQQNMSIQFGGDEQCIYKREDEIKPGDTDPFRVKENGKMYCKVLEGSCFKVQYYRQKGDGNDIECKNKDKFGPGWDRNPTNDSCTQFAFQFMGCAVNETRKMIEYQNTQKKDGQEYSMEHIEVDDQGMCQGELNTKTNTHSCNESMCNSDDYVYHGYKMADWMLKLEERIEIATLAENEAKKSSSPSLAVLLPLLILSILL